MNTQTKDPSQLTFVNVFEEANRNFRPKKSNDLFGTFVQYRTSGEDVENKTLIIYVGDYICKQLGLVVHGRATIVRIPDQPYRIGIQIDEDGMKASPKQYTDEADKAAQIGEYHDVHLQCDLDGLKIPRTKGKRIDADHWEVLEHPAGNVLLVDLPEDQVYIDHVIETE